MFEPVNEREKPLSECVADQIVQLIIDRDLKSGDKLPNEFKLAESLSVGRGTVREAVRLLISRNVLEIRRGKGTFVSKRPGVSGDPLGFAFLKDKHKLIWDLVEIRLILEPEMAAIAARNAKESDIKKMNQLCEEILVLAADNDKSYINLDVELHICIAKCTNNIVMPKLIPIISSGIALYNKLPSYSERITALSSHREIIDSISAHDEDRARDAMKRHLMFNRDNLSKLKDNFETIEDIDI